MSEPSEKFKDLDFLISRIGMPAFILGVVLWFHFHDFAAFRTEMNWKQERIMRNTRAIMQKLNIPVVLDNDKAAEK